MQLKASSRARVLLGLCALACGCRFGGPNGDPSQPIDLRGGGAGTDVDAANRVGGGASGIMGAASGSGSGSGADAGAHDASLAGDTGTTPTTHDDSGAGSGCSAPSTPPAVCNPVKNTGCDAQLEMQCDVDLLATTLAGRCTFSAPMDAGRTCFSSGVTQSCPPSQTCHSSGECRSICACGTDCAPGECCKEAIGTQGWKLCAACP